MKENNELRIKGLEEQIKEREKIKDKRLRDKGVGMIVKFGKTILQHLNVNLIKQLTTIGLAKI